MEDLKNLEKWPPENIDWYYSDKYTAIAHGDCLELLPEMPKIDLVLTDPPYGKTACKWDAVINFDKMWGYLDKIIKINGAIILFGMEPFSSALRMSNLGKYRYDWIWYKNQPSGFAGSNNQPMRVGENISIFYEKHPIYNKQETFSRITDRKLGGSNKRGASKKNGVYGKLDNALFRKATLNKLVAPRTILEFDVVCRSGGTLHPTQKPIKLMEYLIKTYTTEEETVLDFTMGSGTTLVAAKQLNRQAIGIEIEERYCQIAAERLSQGVFDFDCTEKENSVYCENEKETENQLNLPDM